MSARLYNNYVICSMAASNMFPPHNHKEARSLLFMPFLRSEGTCKPSARPSIHAFQSPSLNPSPWSPARWRIGFLHWGKPAWRRPRLRWPRLADDVTCWWLENSSILWCSVLVGVVRPGIFQGSQKFWFVCPRICNLGGRPTKLWTRSYAGIQSFSPLCGWSPDVSDKTCPMKCICYVCHFHTWGFRKGQTSAVYPFLICHKNQKPTCSHILLCPDIASFSIVWQSQICEGFLIFKRNLKWIQYDSMLKHLTPRLSATSLLAQWMTAFTGFREVTVPGFQSASPSLGLENGRRYSSRETPEMSFVVSDLDNPIRNLDQTDVHLPTSLDWSRRSVYTNNRAEMCREGKSNRWEVFHGVLTKFDSATVPQCSRSRHQSNSPTTGREVQKVSAKTLWPYFIRT